MELRCLYKVKMPNCTKKQAPSKDKNAMDIVRAKLNDVWQKGYIANEEECVLSVTSFFDVPKGDKDVQMVYNTTSSGLNEAVWAPWFSLPTVETHLRAVDVRTFMVDADIGEMFLNFCLDKGVRKYAGVDLTVYFPEQKDKKTKKVIEHWTRMLMGFWPSPYSTTRDMRRIEPFLKGNPTKETNVFCWKFVIINLPGSKTYNPNSLSG